MARAQAARTHNIIDLTEGDDDDQLEILGSAASKAQAAATRLTSQFESLTSAAKKRPFGLKTPSGGKLLPARKDVIPAAHGVPIDLTENGGLGPQRLSPKVGLQIPRAGQRPESSGLRKILPNSQDLGPARKEQPTVPKLLKTDQDISHSAARSPRAAAQSAEQMIAKTYELLNPLEAQQEAITSTPRKPGRPRIDQWTPKAHLSHDAVRADNRDKDRGSSLTSPIIPTNDSSISCAIGGSSVPVAPAKLDLASEHKRKRQGASSEASPSSKHAKSVTKPLSYTEHGRQGLHEKALPLLSNELRNRQGSETAHTSQDGKPRSILGSVVDTVAARQAQASRPCGRFGSFGQTGASAGALAHEVTKPVQAPDNEAALREMFEMVVYPAIKKAGRPYKDQISPDEFFSIGKDVSIKVMEEKLKLLPVASLSQPSHNERKEIKDSVKEHFRQRVLEHSKVCLKNLNLSRERTEPSHNRRKHPLQNVLSGGETKDKSSSVNRQASTSSPINRNSNGPELQPKPRPEKITNLSEYLKTLEKETLPGNLDDFKNTSPVRQQALSQTSYLEQPISDRSSSSLTPAASVERVDRPVHPSSSDYANAAIRSSSSSSENGGQRNNPDTSTESSFPPGFDRGRYPAKRRRRGNKYYNPARPSEPSASSQTQSTHRGNHQPSVGRSNTVRSPSLSSLSSFESSLKASEDRISHSLVVRVAADPRAKALLQIVASGKASRAQTEAFQELIDQLNEAEEAEEAEDLTVPTMSLGRFVESRKRKLATALDPHLEGLAADLVLNEPEKPLPAKRTNRLFVNHIDQEALVAQSTLFNYPNPKLKQHEQQLWHSNSQFTRIETNVVDPTWRPERRTASLLRNRELGSDSIGRNVNTYRELRLRNAEKIEAWRYWKGASGDVVAAAWSPDSTTYAVGAAAHTNSEDVQYNRPCNLLLGDLISNTVTELPDHRVDRPRPETLANTYNARQAVYDACDPMVYETVSSIAFSPTADRMYTASHDRTVKIWDTTATQKKCLTTLYHGARVTSVEASAHVPGLFATGSDSIDSSIRIYYASHEDSIPVHTGFSSSRAQARQGLRIYPESIRWGSTYDKRHLLLAGFRQTQNDDDEASREGQICLWDANAFKFVKVLPSSQAVFTAAWHPVLPFFATGGSPGSYLTDKRTTKTVVRIWDLRTPLRYTIEYECSASDMQDLTFHPTDSNIVTVGCTDGASFVWDYRWPNSPLHRLRHGDPLVDWDHTRGEREEVDTGVMLSLWGLGGSLFYTGSSDGMIKAWDIRRHPQDVLVRNVAQFGAGVQSGAISPDGTNMVVGDADGGVHVLSAAPCGPQPEDSGSDDVSPELPMNLVRAPDGSGLALNADDDNPGTDGREEAKYLTESGQIQYDPELGVTQGKMYQGPFANQHRKEAGDISMRRLLMEGNAESKHFFLRTREENEELENRRRGLIAARKQRISMLYPSLGGVQEEAGKTSSPKESL